MAVYPRSGRFVCYRCGASGDAISFVQQLQRLTFREAVSLLQANANFAPAVRRQRLTSRPIRHALTANPIDAAVLSAALDLYRGRLMGDSRALEYLAGRGFDRHLLDRFHVGYAAGDELVPYLVWRNLPVSRARRVGLVESDGSERLGGRIVFPEIRQGQPIWFIGRQLDADETVPKYLGLLGRKPLFGWESASLDLRAACVVEGPLDWIALRQWGLPVLALCGTRIHPDMLSQLGRWSRLYLMLDNDTAGSAAAEVLQDAFGQRAIPISLP